MMERAQLKRKKEAKGRELTPAKKKKHCARKTSIISYILRYGYS